MKRIRKLIIISLLAAILILAISCALPASNKTPSPPPASASTLSPVPSPPPTATPAPTQISTPTLTSSPTPAPSLVIPTPTHTLIPTPIPSPTPDPAKDKRFFIDRIISGYNKIPKPDGSFDQVPIYQDIYLDLNILGYYTKKDAIFVPRIPTLSDHDDWFIRLILPGYLTKPWLINWSYTINKSSPSADKATLSAMVFTQEIFDGNYYKHPELLPSYDLKGDRGPSSSGVYAKYFQNPGNYVILLRTNDANAVADFWVKLGTEGNVITPTP